MPRGIPVIIIITKALFDKKGTMSGEQEHDRKVLLWYKLYIHSDYGAAVPMQREKIQEGN